MKPAGGILKYGLYLFVGAWMFALGVVVGRGTSPVTFDTTSFQDRLRVIVGNIPKEGSGGGEMDLDFFETLDKPAPREAAGARQSVTEIHPRVEKAVPADTGEEEIPVKYSRKLATLNRTPAESKAHAAKEAKPKPSDAPPAVSGTGKPKAPAVPKKGAAVSAPAKTEAPDSGGQYTIQVAAYRAFKDAVSQMSLLEKKGFSSYRTKGEAGGTTWYRVRTGSFKDFQSAQAELNRLKQAKLNGMIIKKDDQ